MRTFISVIFLLVVTAAAAFFAYGRFIQWSKEPLLIDPAQVVEFPADTGLEKLSATLHKQKVVSNAHLFRFWVRFFSDYKKFQAGTYRFEGEISPAYVAQLFIRGEIYSPVVYELTIPEGFTISRLAARLERDKISSREDFLSLAKDETLLKELGIPSSSIEGYLYPATYPFLEMPDARAVIARAVRTFWEKLPPDYEEQVKARGLDLNQAVTFASLIELETANDAERNLISEVIWNRFKDKAALGIDAAIIYGIKDYDGDIKNRHLADASNPYNLRIHPGLPPTAIGSPSRKSLLAVLTPSNEGYYYYVVDVEKGKHHHFSKSLSEHNRYVRKLVKVRRQQRREARRQERLKK